MNSKFLLLFGSLLFFTDFSEVEGKNWALISVGLDYYDYSYSFEAACYKMYHSLVAGGIPKENIILISPDSVAFSPYNPLPGLVMYGYDGEDYSADKPTNQYDGISIDYESKYLTVQYFFDILSGVKNENLSVIGSGRVLESGPQDNVYLYMYTVGVRGMFLLNNRITMYAEKFIPFLEELSEKKAFKKMFIHFHSTAAGSMFDNYMDNDKRIIVYSMGGRYNYFHMCHYNKFLDAYTSTCSGYEYSTYLDKALSENGGKETILDLFSGSGLMAHDDYTVHNLYGQFSLAKEYLKNFIGPNLKNSKTIDVEEIKSLKSSIREQMQKGKSLMKLLSEDKNVPQAELRKIEQNMEQIISEAILNINITRKSVDSMTDNMPFKKFDCFEDSISAMRRKCFTEKSQFVFLNYGDKFYNLCNFNVPKEKLLNSINSIC